MEQEKKDQDIIHEDSAAAPKALHLFDRALSLIETWILGLGLGLMIFVMFAQGVLSRPLGFDWPWSEKLALQLMTLVTIVGASAAVREGRHIAIDALVRLLPARVQALLGAAVAALCVAACAAAFKPAFSYVHLYRTTFAEMNIHVIVTIPLWYTRLFLPLGLGLLSARFALVFADEIRAVSGARRTVSDQGRAGL